MPSADSQQKYQTHPRRVRVRVLRDENEPRVLSNPPHRLEIESDFPDPVCNLNHDIGSLLLTLEGRLWRYGESLSTVKRIHIAYSQKDPDLYPDHSNRSIPFARNVIGRLSSSLPSVKWINAQNIYETIRLRRSFDQNPLHSFQDSQIYRAGAIKNIKTIPFIDPGNERPEYFVLLDEMFEQGTTLANLRSYILHNGGVVLAVGVVNCLLTSAFAQRASVQFAETRDVALAEDYTREGRNNRKMPDLAVALQKSAIKSGFNLSASDCLAQFSSALASNWAHSVHALTDGECQRTIETMMGMRGAYYDVYKGLIQSLNRHKTEEADAFPFGHNGQQKIPKPGN